MFPKIRKYMNKYKGLLMILLCIIIITAVLLYKKSHNSEEEIAETTPIEVIDAVQPQITSPEIAAPSDIVVDDNGTYNNISSGYSFKVPEEYNLSKSGNIYYIRTPELDTQLYLVVTSNSYTDNTIVWEQMSGYAYRSTAYIKEESAEIPVYGYAEHHQENVVVGDFDCIKEDGELWFHEVGGDSYKKDEYALFTTFTPNPDNAIKKGILLYGFSDTKSKEEVFDDMSMILESLETYALSEKDKDYSVSLDTFTSAGGSGVSFNYPLNWNVRQNTDGLIVISATDDVTDPFNGMSICFFEDTENKVVEDYAQFSGAYESEIIKATAFTQAVSSQDFSYTHSITSMDLNKKLGEKDVIYYEIQNEVIPASPAARNSLKTDETTFIHKRYAFRSNGIDCMLDFCIPNDYCEILVNDILDSVKAL